MSVLFLSYVYSHWRKIITPIAAIAVASAFLFFPKGQTDDNAFVMSGETPIPELIEEELEEEIETTVQLASEPIVVDVKGAVRNPGVYSMSEGDRLIDAINAAGGYLPDADSRMLNHAMKLADEFVIYVPIEGEESSDIVTAPTSMPGTSAQQNDGKININLADEAELMTIPGIGPSKATAIVQYRTDQGLFKTPESLMEVSGIGQKTFEKLETHISVK